MFDFFMGAFFLFLFVLVAFVVLLGIAGASFSAGRRSVHRELVQHEGEVFRFTLDEGCHRGRFFLEGDSK